MGNDTTQEQTAAEKIKAAWGARELAPSLALKRGSKERELAHLCANGAWEQARKALSQGARGDQRESALSAAELGLVKPSLPIQMAAAAGELSALRLMLDLGCDPNAANGGEPARPLFIALQALSPGCVDALLAAKANYKARGPMCFGYRRGSVSALAALLLGGGSARRFSDPESGARDQRRWIECAEALRRHGADFNEPSGKDPKSARPLQLAIESDLPFAVETLLSFGATVDFRTTKGLSPLDLAVSEGRSLSARALIGAGCAPSDLSRKRIVDMANEEVDPDDWDLSAQSQQERLDRWRSCVAELERQELSHEIEGDEQGRARAIKPRL